ncbi:DNA/RNA helicase domain-containing protein [Ascidiimonas sp. W6]|uniref:DNA/RNA helicase domain-containing protein n=1 Tax=Ascidiimonas meishanensis TaxID=3128903 RepID=UPI0030EB43B1
MNGINIFSLSEAGANLNNELLKRYLSYNNLKIKDNEVEDISSLVNSFSKIAEDLKEFNNFYVGYTIPQISKEFDLLRFGGESLVNIEIKRTSTQEKIQKQLVQNRYYLSFLGRTMYSFTYIVNQEKFYTLNALNELVATSVDDVMFVLRKQKSINIPDINTLFNPSNYLISPFNSTEKFIQKQYFLTNQQDKIKKLIVDEISNDQSSFFSIYGRAGTGKTLLTYDITNEYISSKQKVLVIHCGKLNQGHYELRDTYSWNIIPIRDLTSVKLTEFDLIVVDEVQRIYPSQLDTIFQAIKKNHSVGIFSYDPRQCLRKWETNNNIEEKILSQEGVKKFELTKKIRTNKEIAYFIQGLFDKGKVNPIPSNRNIDVNYFRNYESATAYIELLKQDNWTAINYTPSKKHNHPYERFSVISSNNAHEVIGQEFDKVIAVLDSHFYYDGNKLSTKGYKSKPYYHPTKMLLQIMTRTRLKLSVIIINNEEILEQCINLLDKKSS